MINIYKFFDSMPTKEEMKEKLAYTDVQLNSIEIMNRLESHFNKKKVKVVFVDNKSTNTTKEKMEFYKEDIIKDYINLENYNDMLKKYKVSPDTLTRFLKVWGVHMGVRYKRNIKNLKTEKVAL